MSTRSGASSAVSAAALSPSAASPTTSTPGTVDNNEPGSKGGYDNDNRYYGTTWAGGVNGYTTLGQMPNDAFPLMQASYAIYFFICASSQSANDALLVEVDDV